MEKADLIKLMAAKIYCGLSRNGASDTYFAMAVKEAIRLSDEVDRQLGAVPNPPPLKPFRSSSPSDSPF